MKYDVHLFPIVRVKVLAVEADSQEEAIRKAEESTDFNDLFNKEPDIEYAEEVAYYLVDEVGDEEYERTSWHDGAFTSDPQKRNVNELIAALTDCRDALGEYLQSVESGKDDDAESAYQHADALLKGGGQWLTKRRRCSNPSRQRGSSSRRPSSGCTTAPIGSGSGKTTG